MRSAAASDRLATNLIRAAQRGVLEPGGMTGFATLLAEAMNGIVVVATNGGEAGGVPHVDACVGLEHAALAAYRDHFCRITPWAGWIGSAPRYAVGTGRAVNPLDPAAYERTEFYCDFLRPNDLHHGLGARVEQDGRMNTDIAMLRPRRAGAVEAGEAQMVRRVLPHVRAALRARRLCAASGWSPWRLDSPGLGVLLTDRTGKLLFANARGTDYLVDGSAIGARSRRIASPDPAASTRLHLFIRRALEGTAGDLLLPRRANGTALRVTTVPIPPRTDAFGDLDAACMMLLRERSPISAG